MGAIAVCTPMGPALLLCLLAASPAGPAPAAAALVPECHTSEGQVACGFNCKVGLGVAKCAQTPDGFCQTLDGQVICWDPPEVVQQHPPKKPIVPACHSKFGEMACGFICESSPTKMECTQTPYGACLSKFDQVLCWDPSEPLIHLSAPELPQARCLATQMEIACGYHCKSVYQQVACAQTPQGRCVVTDGKVGCWDPPLPQNPGHVH